MRLFHPDSRREKKDLWATYEIAYTAVDFAAAFAFVVGSVLFYFDPLHFWATTLFLVGSILFAAKPTIRFLREVAMAGRGEVDQLAERES